MQALPSIAFGGFSGSAKGVTARQVGGRTILSVKSFPTGQTTVAQVVRRASLTKISKSYKLLSDSQMREWERLAEHCSGASVFGQKAQLTGANLYVRLNANRVMAGEAIISDAPASQVAVPNVSYSQVAITPQLIVFGGIVHESSPYKLVVKMSGSQSAGVSNGWSKTVIISSDVEDDWGEADVTRLYLKTIGVEPTPGQKVFIEIYWLDTSTGFAGQVFKDSVIVTGESSFTPRKRVTMDRLAPDHEQHVSAIDVDFSTGSPVIQFDAMCLGHSNVASSEVYLEDDLPTELRGTSWALGRGNGEDGKLVAQSYVMWLYGASYGDPARIVFAHRGGYYVKPTEVFGPGILY
ncbi:MAG: hypothetical protein IKX20_06755 [Paludibacteraceae bacterium]|nr:hypothetical protein [Paludibacteraceae bacterium]